MQHKLSTKLEKLIDHPRGPVIAVRFSGVYPPGSDGNEFAAAMVQFLRSAFAKTNAVGAVLDLTQLDYVWGDAIAGLAAPFLDTAKTYRRGAIVAAGRTALALEPLLQPNFVMGIARLQLAETRQQALELLLDALTNDSPVAAPALASLAKGQKIKCRMAACRVENTAHWEFFLINDENAPLSALLNELGTEWGDQSDTRSVHVRIRNLAPKSHELIWRDNGDDTEFRMDFHLQARVRRRMASVLFEFPKLYLLENLPIVDWLGRPGLEVLPYGHEYHI